MRPLLHHLAIIMVLVFAPLAAAAQDAEAPDVLEVIGPAEITQEDVARALQSRPDLFADLPEPDRSQRALQRLVAEVLVDYLYAQTPEDLSEDARERLAAARRQLLLRDFARAQFTPPTVTDADIAAFVADNPHLFSDRALFRFLDISVESDTPEARQEAVAQILQLLRDAGPDLAGLHALTVELEQDNGPAASVLTRWTTSDALAAETRTRLEAMAAEGRVLDVADEDGVARILMLLDRVPAPVAPEKMRDEIEARLEERAYGEQREILVGRMAASVMPDLTATEADGVEPLDIALPEATPPAMDENAASPRGSRVAALVMSWLFGVVGVYATLSWGALVRRQYPHQRARLTSVPILSRPMPSALLGGLLALCQVAVLILAVVLGAPALGLVASGGAAIAALIMAGGIAWLWQGRSERNRRMAEEALRAKLSDDAVAARQALLREPPHVRLRAAGFLLLASMLAGLVLLGDAMAAA
jgi:hypothetical protein